jgi:hypothetical protein
VSTGGALNPVPDTGEGKRQEPSEVNSIHYFEINGYVDGEVNPDLLRDHVRPGTLNHGTPPGADPGIAIDLRA